MKHIMIFEKYMNESKNSTFSHSVLSALEPTIAEMVEKIKEWIVNDYDKKGIEYNINQWEVEMIRLGLIKDMLKSFEKYTEPTDLLKIIEPRKGSKGIEIFATIIRDGEEYKYYTEAISAGGYNIQSFHFRYLTKTNLPKPKIKGTLAIEYDNRIKKLSKIEKLNMQIKTYETKIEKINTELLNFNGITDEEISKILSEENDGKYWGFNSPTWSEIIKRGADKNYDYSEEKYNASVKKAKEQAIESWKLRNIIWPMETRQILQKNLNKLNLKLSALL